jgi:hypothetical protein
MPRIDHHSSNSSSSSSTPAAAAAAAVALQDLANHCGTPQPHRVNVVCMKYCVVIKLLQAPQEAAAVAAATLAWHSGHWQVCHLDNFLAHTCYVARESRVESSQRHVQPGRRVVSAMLICVACVLEYPALTLYIDTEVIR